MYQTSDEYKELVYDDDTQHLLNIYIEGNEVNPNHIFEFKVSHTLFSNDEFSFGGVTAKSIEFRIHKNSLPETYNNFYVETGVGNEIVPIGYFILDSIGKEDDDTVTIKAIDYMVKFEFNYDGSKLTFPATMLKVLQDICSKAGVECGSTSFLNDDKTIAVHDNSVSAREYLSYIAGQAGGFACIGRDGKLYIRTIGQDISEIGIKYFQNFTWGEQFKVSRVAYEDGVQDFKHGDETSNTVWINSDNMYIVDKEQIENIYNEYCDFECYCFEGTTIIDPAIDIGDIVVIDGKRVIFQGDMEYVGKFKVDISSEIQVKSKEETTTTKVSDKTKLRRVQSSIDQINGEIVSLVKEVDDNSSKMTEVLQTVDKISQKVENVAGLTDEINGTTSITLENCMAGNLYELHIYGNNTVFGGLYPSEGLFPSKGLYPRKATSLIEVTDKDGNTTTYDLNVYPVLRQSGEYCDEFVIKDGKAYVVRRITLNDDGTVVINEAGVVENEREFAIPLAEGDNTISVLNYSANMHAKWVVKNDYTDVFATKIEMDAEITHTAQEITDKVTESIEDVNGELTTISSELTRQADKIEAKLDSDDFTSSAVIGLINNRDGTSTAKISATNVDLTGLVKATDLSGSGSTIINGDNIKTGTISADRLDTSKINSITGTIGGFTITSDSLDSATTGMSNGHQYAFYVKNGNATPYYVTMSGDLVCQTLLVGNYGVVRTVLTEGQMITNNYVDGNQIITTTANSLYITIPDSISSDRNLKENIKDTDVRALDIIKQLEFVQFDWKGNGEHEDIGVIAQEVEEISKMLVSDVTIPDGTKSKVFNNSKMLFVNSKSIQELNNKVEKMEEKMETLQEENAELKSTIEKLILRIENLEKGEIEWKK